MLQLGVDAAPKLLDLGDFFLLGNDILHKLIAVPVDSLAPLVEVDYALVEFSRKTGVSLKIY